VRLLSEEEIYVGIKKMNMRSQSAFFRKTSLLRLMINLLLLPPVIAPATAYAQDAWQIDPNNSIATFSSGAAAQTLQVGVARVSGEVVFDSADPSDPTVRFSLNSNESAATYASMSFISRQCARTADGKLRAIGELSVTRVERSVTIDANEAYAGPQYGDPVAHTDTRQITVLFTNPRRGASDNGTIRFSGTSTVVREHFPQLVDAITTDWPSQVINNEKCTSPSTISEDYHGAECTGTVIASLDNPMVATGASGGEGFYGFVPVVTPDRDKATIALDLTLRKVPAPFIASRSKLTEK
jgi:polyisoprenoid-binding protein YceI